jgi:hypothetical protein
MKRTSCLNTNATAAIVPIVVSYLSIHSAKIFEFG